MKKILLLTLMLAALTANAQFAWVTRLDLDQEWIHTWTRGNHTFVEHEVGLVEVRYSLLDDWQIQQSADLVNWFDVEPVYAEIDDGVAVGTFTIILRDTGTTRAQFFRLDHRPRKKNGR